MFTCGYMCLHICCRWWWVQLIDHRLIGSTLRYHQDEFSDSLWWLHQTWLNGENPLFNREFWRVYTTHFLWNWDGFSLLGLPHTTFPNRPRPGKSWGNSALKFIVDTTQNEHPILRDSSDISTLWMIPVIYTVYIYMVRLIEHPIVSDSLQPDHMRIPYKPSSVPGCFPRPR